MPDVLAPAAAPLGGYSARVRWAARAGAWMVRLLGLTWRIRTVNDHVFAARGERAGPAVFVIWHGQMLPMLYHHRHQGVVVLISQHGDGEIIARIATQLGFRTVRGSTSRGAGRALVGLGSALTQGCDVAITPDGPRGPARSFAAGALLLAQRSGVPVVPVAAAVSRAWRLRTWDRFTIPKPFSTVTIAYGNGMRVAGTTPREAAEDASRFQSALERLEEVAMRG